MSQQWSKNLIYSGRTLILLAMGKEKNILFHQIYIID